MSVLPAAGLAFGGGVLALVLLTAALGDPAPAATEGGAGAGLKPGAVPAAYEALVTAAGAVCPAFPASVIAAQIQVESGWNPSAVSPAGAEGISQFEPGTWATWGADADGNGTSSPFDPGDAIPAQARFDCALAQQMTAAITAGEVTGISVTDAALAAYNAGPGAVLAAGGIPQNGQTPAYVAEIDRLALTYTTPTTGTGAPAAGESAFGAAMVAAAEPDLGLPYVWGGGDTHGPTGGGFDCSGLVLYAAYVASGGSLVLPHDSNVQGRMGTQVALGLGSTIDLSRLQPGDVIAFNLDGGDHFSHIGIYVGGGMLLHASHPGAGGGVKLESLTEAYWAPYLWSVRRYG